MILKISIISLMSLLSACSFAQKKTNTERCEWQRAQTLGKLEEVLNEASGLAISQDGRLYHVNDSGNQNTVYITDTKGNFLSQFQIKDAKNFDVEDLAYGRCPFESLQNEKCLYVGDIGDNGWRKKPRTVWVIVEKNQYELEEKPVLTLKFEFPHKGRMDSEGIAIHPNGDLFILSKNINLKTKAVGPNHIYKITQAQMADKKTNRSKTVLTPETVADFDIQTLNPARGILPSWLFYSPTSLDIHPNGKHFLILTYGNALEFDLDLGAIDTSATGPITLSDKMIHQKISVRVLAQQEAITYTQDGKHFLYTSEKALKFPQNLLPSAEIVEMSCLP